MSNISNLFPQQALPSNLETFCPHNWIWTHWNLLRGSKLLPTEDSIFPVGVALALDDAFLLQRGAAQTSQIVTAGQNISALYDRDLRGASMSSIVDPCFQRYFETQTQKVFSKPGVIIALNLIADTKNQDLLKLQILPVLDKNDTVAHAIGTITTIERSQSCAVEIFFDELLPPAPTPKAEEKIPYLSVVSS
ncbi:MAG: PAS domain-containing protein [Planktomarina sp.]